MAAGVLRESALRISDCVTELLRRQPFFGSLVLRLPLRPDPSREILATDGHEIRYSPQWVANTDAHLIETAMARVVMACALKHHTRRGERNPRVHALFAALVAFRLLPKGSANRDLRETVAPPMALSVEDYHRNRTTCDLRRMRLCGLIERIPHTRRYRVARNEPEKLARDGIGDGGAPRLVVGGQELRRDVERFLVEGVALALALIAGIGRVASVIVVAVRRGLGG